MNELEKVNSDKQQRRAGLTSVLGLAGLTTAAGWMLYSATMIDHNMPLPLALNSDRRLHSSGAAGLLSYYVDQSSEGRPLVLLHSINAAASAYEMRPIFEHYRRRRPVYALDLPGYGFSERSDRYYSPDLYTAAVRDFLAAVVGEPADLVALSLSSEFAAKAAAARPELIRSLALISPTGLSSSASKDGGKDSANGGSNNLLNLFLFPLWSQAFFDLLATGAGIRYYLGKSFNGPIDPGLAAYAYLSAHQPGARFAPLHFISGKLFTPGILNSTYARLPHPALVVYDVDPYTSFEALPDLLLTHPNWSVARVTPTRGLPQFEQMPTLAKVLDNFWQSIEQ